MQRKKLGWTNLNLSTIGLGTWAIGGGGWKYSWGFQNDRDSDSTIQRAVELGINWIDTAPIYGLGHSEEVVGKAIKKSANKPIIATKCGLIWNKNRHMSQCLKKESIRTEIEGSLTRLKIDVIDLYQIHWPTSNNDDIEEAWNAIAELIKEGKIRYAGVSNFSVEQLKRIQPIHPVASLQPPYSILERGIERDILDYCSSNNIGVIVYSPMQKGILTGKFSWDYVQNLPKDDHRRKDPHFQEEKLRANLKLVKELCFIAERNSKSVAQLAIAWVLRRPEVTAAIVGARHPSQIEKTVPAGGWRLFEEDIEAIHLLLKKYQKN